jgi:hypothetical protein
LAEEIVAEVVVRIGIEQNKTKCSLLYFSAVYSKYFFTPLQQINTVKKHNI